MGEHLTGWKQIAARLGVSVRTAQRWGRTLGLPVARVPRPGGSEEVRAEAAEIDLWLEVTATSRQAEQVAPEYASIEREMEGAPRSPVILAHGPPARRWATLAVWSVLSALAVAGVFVGTRQSAPGVPRALAIVPSGSPRSNIVGDTRGQLVGRIAVDLNGNGEWDAGEVFVAEPGRDCPNTKPVAGFVIAWSGPVAGSSAPMNCNPEPFYHGRLTSGRYHVALTTPPGWQVTSAARAEVDIDPGRDTHLWFVVAEDGRAPTR